MALFRFLFSGANATHKSSLGRGTILGNEGILSVIINGDFKLSTYRWMTWNKSFIRHFHAHQVDMFKY